MIKTENGWHIDDNNNRWNADLFTIEQAEMFSKTLINCMDCWNCIHCSHCSYCNDCSHCSYCNDCSHCSYCNDCHDCRENPQRIFGWKMGSRGDIPAVYWLEPGKEWCAVGCFRGTLDELEAKVKEVHKDNPEHLQNYLKFIAGVKSYQKATNN